ncbi:Uncharacterized protein PECH_002958 [Penicillium ucsense]|uniref:MOZ protein represents a chromatin-associated acetyltransferase n=1 Tax=Penicillium ucsense TaxID=2839758 RepID=A0A8J8W673_9EURO|nr:Uncharacterized protein PECM_003929 [Penicillium ucsense]KAF7737782.1 Uncharacterized protein PECH_002958 [Penicillium ucsense]
MRRQETYQRRYGPAVEPNLPPPPRPQDNQSGQGIDEKTAAPNTENTSETETDASNSDESPSQAQQEAQLSQVDTHQDMADAAASTLSEQAAGEATKRHATLEPPLREEECSTHEDESSNSAGAQSSMSGSGDAGEEMSQMPPYMNRSAFEDVYHMPSPNSGLATTEAPAPNKPPHMSPAPYVHHFDTYSLVLDLSRGGYTSEQSITIMKAVRTILQNNLDFAKQSLTSKSDVENEEYLFKAACSELQQSLQTARNSEVQRQRASRTQLEHETDILSQRLNQELAGMKDEIKGMFNDHKMATREHQRVIDTMVQESNYKITVSLNSDGKSEIEGLRWILTRRAALTVAICAFMIIVFLKYSSVRRTKEPKPSSEAEKPVTKEVTKETRVIQETTPPMEGSPVVEAHLGESLG